MGYRGRPHAPGRRRHRATTAPLGLRLRHASQAISQGKSKQIWSNHGRFLARLRYGNAMNVGCKIGLLAASVWATQAGWSADLVERHDGTPGSWLEKPHPEELAVVTEIDPRCPDPRETYRDIVQAVLKRAGIRAHSRPLESRELYVKLELTCLEDARMYYTSNVTVRFWAVRPGHSTHFSDESSLYGELHNNAGRDDIRAAVSAVLHRALLDYRRANGLFP